MVLEGRVIQKSINIGSKSEHEAVVLVSQEGEFKLRRQGGHPFTDPDVLALVGTRIRARGFVSAGQFIMEAYDVVSSESEN